MWVERIVADRWRGARSEEEVIDNPTVDDFVRSFLALDAQERTILCLDAKNGCQLTIGGGAGQYIVYVSFSENEFWSLISNSEAKGIVILNTGGQNGDFPVRQVVDAARARQAGVSFLEKGELDSRLLWEKQTARL